MDILVRTEYGQFMCHVEKIGNKYVASDGLDSRSGDTLKEAQDRMAAFHFTGKELEKLYDREISLEERNRGYMERFGGKSASEAFMNMTYPEYSPFPKK